VKREQGLLLIVVALLGLLSWGLLSGGSESLRRRGGALQLELAELGATDPVAALELGADGARDPFREPREEAELAPLGFALPELGELPVLLPPPLPDGGADHWSGALMTAAPRPVGGIEDLVDVENGGDPGELDSAGGSLRTADVDWTETYDSVRSTAFTVLYGRILNESRWDLKKGDPLVFQEVDVATGEDRFGAQRIAGDAYQDFALARTLRNEIERRVRQVNPSPGSIVDRIDFIDWLLEQGVREPVAFEHAERLAVGGIGLVPDDLSTWMTLGRVWEQTFRFDEAFALYARLAGEKLPAEQPEMPVDPPFGRFERSSAPRVGMARILRRLYLDADAEAPLRRAVTLNDGDPSAPLELGLLLLDDGRATEALTFLQRAQPQHSSRSSAAAIRNGVAIGRAKLALGRWDAASSAFADAERAAESAGDLRGAGAVEARAGRVAAAYLAGKFSQAADLAGTAVEELGADPRLLYLRGIATAASGGPAGEVVRDLRAAAAGFGLDGAVALAAQAFWLDVLGEDDAAREALARALELAPNLPYGVYLRGAWARRDGDAENARADLRSVIQKAPGCASALAEYGWLLAEEGRQELAEVALRRAESEAPEQTAIVVRRAFNLLQMAEWDGAVETLSRALALDPDLHAARNGLAWAAYAQGDLGTALAEFGELQDRLRDEEAHSQRQYAALWQSRIDRHSQLRSWRDPFDGNLLRPQWDAQTQARLGVEPRVLGGHLQIRGMHRGAGRTRVARSLPAIQFQSFAVDLATGPDDVHKGDAGVFIALESARGDRQTWVLEVERDRDGRIRWSMAQGARTESGDTGLTLPPETPGRVEFTVDREQATPLLTVRFAGNVIFQQPVPALRSAAGNMAVGGYASTRNALPVDISLDEVELVYQQS